LHFVTVVALKWQQDFLDNVTVFVFIRVRDGPGKASWFQRKGATGCEISGRFRYFCLCYFFIGWFHVRELTQVVAAIWIDD
jgi:hypothetical protein